MPEHRRTRGRPGLRRTLALLLGAATGLVAAQAVPTSAAAVAPVGCSSAELIAALTAANASHGSITLSAGCRYTLAAADNATDGGNGLPVITGVVTVNGNGATITRAGGAPAFRFFDIEHGAGLTLSNLTLSAGQAMDTGAQSIGGGAINNLGTLTVTGVSFDGNSSPAPEGSSGGAINSSGSLTVVNSLFQNNLAQEGGGFLSQGTATVRQSTFRNNTATDFGGGAFVTVHGSTDVYDSTFVGNVALDNPANINPKTGSPYSVGGGAIDNDDTVNVYNSTFTGNQGGSSGGGAIQNFGTMRIVQSTIAGNASAYGANVHNFDQTYPNVMTASMTISQSILDDPQGGGTNCSGTADAVADGGYNIASDDSCGFTAAKNSIVKVKAQPQPLANNGGPTQTMALSATSPAVDVVPAAKCASSADQRGVSRPQGAGCDIGAYEYVPPPVQPPPPPVQPKSPFFDVPQNSPFLADIQWLLDQRITTGYPDGGFHPDSPVTRAAMAAYLYRYAHGGTDGGTCTGTTPFPDVPASFQFCADIAWLATSKITNGYADGLFHPELPVSREAVAAFLYRLAHGGAQAGECAGAAPFGDIARTSAFCTAIAWLASSAPQQITNGYPDGLFHPLAATSRQTMAAYLHRYETDYHGYGAI